MAHCAVLSIDGCGFRGRTQLLVLEELMTRMASPDPVKRPCEVFDLIVGTAAGGLIAILLGRLGMHCGDAIKLKTIITRALGPQANTLMFDPANKNGCNTLVTLVSQNAVTDKDAYRIRSYKDPKLIPDAQPITGYIWKIWEAAIGTTSCPRLFSPPENPTAANPGSLFQAANASGFSNPSMIAYIEALDLFGNNANITLYQPRDGTEKPGQ
ncbi:FabD/lysophospholipase-like protein [Phlegmacium glaucopus]|nr:FabD/lysophospholipase-like protein [Phlegmacium glaucopus]